MNTTTPDLLEQQYDLVYSGPVQRPAKEGGLELIPTRRSTRWHQERGKFRDIIKGPKAEGKDFQHGGIFGTTSDPGGPRNDETIVERQDISLDLDAATPDQVIGMVARIEDSGVAALWYTTASHTAEHPRLRFHFPTGSIPGEEYEGWARAVGDWLGGQDLFDGRSFSRSQFMYLMAPDAKSWEKSSNRPVLDVVTPVQTPAKAPRKREPAAPVGPVLPAHASAAEARLQDALAKVQDAPQKYPVLNAVMIQLYGFALAIEQERDDFTIDHVTESFAGILGDWVARNRGDWGRLTDPNKAGGALADATAELPDISSAADDFAAMTESPPNGPSWARADLSSYFDGTNEPVQATLGIRLDGIGLFYPGRTHSVYGESESGKSLAMQGLAGAAIKDGKRVLYIDCESQADEIYRRIVSFGVTGTEAADRFYYIRPEASPLSAAEQPEFEKLLADKFDFCVIDGVTQALSHFGFSTNDNDEFTRWQNLVPDRLARYTGAAVVTIDHVTKSPDGRGRYAVGAMSKLTTVSGSAFMVHKLDAGPVPGGTGTIVFRVTKDRVGGLRRDGVCTRYASDSSAEAALFTFDDTVVPEVLTIMPPRPDKSGSGEGEWPTDVMALVAEVLQEKGELSGRAILALVSKKKETTQDAIEILRTEGYVSTRKGPRNSTLHRLVRTYPPLETEEDFQDSPVPPPPPTAPH